MSLIKKLNIEMLTLYAYADLCRVRVFEKLLKSSRKFYRQTPVLGEVRYDK
jgi:hypothetical protein